MTDNPNLEGITEPGPRLQAITSHLYSTCYQRVARGMLHQDRLVFALLLARIYLKSAPGEHAMDQEFQVFMRGGEKSAAVPSDVHGLNAEQSVAVHRLVKSLPAFKNLIRACSGAGLATWLAQTNPELEVPESLGLWEEDKPFSPCQRSMYQLLVIQALRSDRIPSAALQFVAAVLGQTFLRAAEGEPDMPNVIETQIEPSSPVLFCSVPGYDASGRVDDLAAELGKQLTSIAIGSAEGFNEADKVRLYMVLFTL